MGGGAFEVNVSLVHGHFPVVPGLGTLTTWGSSAADSEVFVGESDWSSDFDAGSFGITDKAIGDLLDGLEGGTTEGDSGLLDCLVFDDLLFVFVSH